MVVSLAVKDIYHNLQDGFRSPTAVRFAPDSHHIDFFPGKAKKVHRDLPVLVSAPAQRAGPVSIVEFELEVRKSLGTENRGRMTTRVQCNGDTRVCNPQLNIHVSKGPQFILRKHRYQLFRVCTSSIPGRERLQCGR